MSLQKFLRICAWKTDLIGNTWQQKPKLPTSTSTSFPATSDEIPIHVPGKELYTPDTLSRAPLSNQLKNFDIELFVHTLTDSLSANKDRLNTGK